MPGQFYTPKDFRGDRPNYHGRRRNIQTALALAGATCATWQDTDSCPVYCFAFGYPGTGKSMFPKVLAWELNKSEREPSESGQPWFLEIMNCLHMALLPGPDLRQEVAETEVHLWTKQCYPMILVIDEIDAVSRRPGVRAAPESELSMTYWTMDTLKRLREESRRCLVIALTNYPELCDANIKTEIGTHIYFGAPEFEIIEGIIRDHGIQNASLVAKQYWKLCAEQGRVALERPLVVALSLYEHLRVGPGTLADQLFILALPPTRAEFDLYERENRARIDAAVSLQKLLGADDALASS